MINYEEASTPDATQLEQISVLAKKQQKLLQLVQQAENALATAQAALRQVQEIDLPDAMLAAGCKAFTLDSGDSIKVVEGISASLSAEKRVAACAWLRDHGYGDLVSDDVTLSFGKGQEDKARALAVELIGRGLIPRVVTNVNTGTLKALIREKMEEGVDMPLDTLGAYLWRKAEIKGRR
jgi:hypothetical protein